MNQPTARPDHNRLALACLFVLCVLLGAAAHPSGAVAAIAPNPNPGLIARWEPCEPNTGVTVIVNERKIGTEKVYVGCALGEQANGVEALQHAGFHIEGTKEYGLAFICRIEGEPTPAEQGCEQSAPADAYWAYWHAKPGGQWSYSGLGAASYKPQLGSVEGWGFDGGPGIEPMDGAGPHTFTLPPIQESSVIPAMLAQKWLTLVLDETAVLAEEDEVKRISEHPEPQVLLSGVIALTRAGVQPAALKPLTHWLVRTCEEKGVSVGSCALRGLANPSAPRSEQYPARFAIAVLGLQALGENPSSFAGIDLRAALEGMIEGSTGEVANGGTPSEAVIYTAPTVLALARTGTLTAKALKTVDLILAQQNTSTGSFEVETSANVEAIQALVAAREQGESVLGQSRVEAIETALVKAGGYLESIQEPDGGILTEKRSESDVESTSLGAVGLALAGRHAAAEKAAKWVSRYQVTAEYAGIGNAEAGEHTPAEDVIGAFTEGEGALKEALAYGVGSSFRGPYTEAQLPTIDALLALATAGPYGPYDAVFDQESLFFENRPVGSASKALTATLTNEDVRPVTIATVVITGEEAGDFQLTGGSCAGHTLQPGQSCEAQVSFNPTTTGLHEALLQATVQGTSQTMQIPLDGTGIPAPEPQPQPKTEPGPAPLVSPPSPPVPGHSASGPVAGVAVQSISPARLLLKLTAPGVVTVKIARQLGNRHHRRWQTIKTIVVKAGKAGALDVKLPRLTPGSYRMSIGLAGAKTIVRTLTVSHRRR